MPCLEGADTDEGDTSMTANNPSDNPQQAADREQMVRRAREVLTGAGWVFDAFIEAEMQAIRDSGVEEREAREEAYRRARRAAGLKGRPGAPIHGHDLRKPPAERRRGQEKFGGNRGRKDSLRGGGGRRSGR